MNPNTLALMGPQLLANVAADLAAAGLAVPSRQVFAHGQPVRDCDQLAVWIQKVEAGGGGSTSPRPGQGPTYGPITQIVTWGIDLTVCGSEVTPTPDVAAVNADGVLGSKYLWTMSRLLADRYKAGSMFAPIVPSMTDSGRGLTITGSSGGMDGAMVTVVAALSYFTKDLLP